MYRCGVFCPAVACARFSVCAAVVAYPQPLPFCPCARSVRYLRCEAFGVYTGPATPSVADSASGATVPQPRSCVFVQRREAKVVIGKQVVTKWEPFGIPYLYVFYGNRTLTYVLSRCGRHVGVIPLCAGCGSVTPRVVSLHRQLMEVGNQWADLCGRVEAVHPEAAGDADAAAAAASASTLPPPKLFGIANAQIHRAVVPLDEHDLCMLCRKPSCVVRALAGVAFGVCVCVSRRLRFYAVLCGPQGCDITEEAWLTTPDVEGVWATIAVSYYTESECTAEQLAVEPEPSTTYYYQAPRFYDAAVRRCVSHVCSCFVVGLIPPVLMPVRRTACLERRSCSAAKTCTARHPLCLLRSASRRTSPRTS